MAFEQSLFRPYLGTLIFRILVPTWPQLGPQLGPKINQKSIQEPSKIDPKSHHIFDRFFDRCLVDFWSIFDPKIDQKSIKKRSTNHPNNTSTKNQKTIKNVELSTILATSAMPCWVNKSIKNGPTYIKKHLSNQHPNLDRFWRQLGSILGRFWEPKWGQVGTKLLQNSISKSIKKLITF